MAIERTYNVPLRKEWLKAPKYRRAKKTVAALKEFLARHMKVDLENVKVGQYANLKIWENGIRNPPHHIAVNVTKDDEGKVFAEIVGAPVQKKEEKKQTKKAVKSTDSEREQKKEEIRKKLEEAKKKKESVETKESEEKSESSE